MARERTETLGRCMDFDQKEPDVLMNCRLPPSRIME